MTLFGEGRRKRSFPGRSVFDETMPMGAGLLEVSFQVDLATLQAVMKDWLARKFGGRKSIKLSLREQEKNKLDS